MTEFRMPRIRPLVCDVLWCSSAPYGLGLLCVFHRRRLAVNSRPGLVPCRECRGTGWGGTCTYCGGHGWRPADESTIEQVKRIRESLARALLGESA